MSCQINPLQQFVAKGDQIDNLEFGRRFAQQDRHTQQQLRAGPVEHSFLNGQQSESLLGNRFMEVQQPTPVVPTENGSSAWLNQFSGMKLEDPLEFDNEYKRLYAGYQSQQSHTIPRNVARISPSLHRSIYRQPQAPVLRKPVTSSADGHFEKAFEALERELQEDADEMMEEDGFVDNEQYEFRRIASDIVDSCSSNSGSPSPVSSKLSGSKFMSLMRGISGGLVTLNKNSGVRANELCAPDGTVIGNRYTPVNDHVHNVMD